jgi:hypothetical protein
VQAQQRLAQSSFLPISRQDALQLLAETSAQLTSSNIYLVRASAFYVDQTYAIGSSLRVFYYPDEALVEILNYSLSRLGALPSNVAIIIETDAAVKTVDVICLTAA